MSRAGFYRFSPEEKGKGDTALRDAMQRIALEFPSYGWRRMMAELKRRGWAVNHKRVYGLMGEDNLLCLRKRRFIVTSESDHPFAVYPNLAAKLKDDHDQEGEGPQDARSGRLAALRGFDTGGLDPSIDKKGDPHHGKERFKEPEHSRPPGAVVVVKLFAVSTWASKGDFSVSGGAIPRGTYQYRSEIL